MNFSSKKTYLGLDIGQTTVRLLELSQNGKKPVITRTEELNIAEEGILDEMELFSDAGLGKFIKEKKLEHKSFTLGLPQYLCTTRNVNDFAANAKPEQLEAMVKFETSQLAGLSENTFISDYQTMPPAFGIEAPVIIGFTRENLTEEMDEKCRKLSIGISDLAMNGMALANAFCYLHPEEHTTDNLHIVIDIGAENSTIILVAHGNVIYTGSMMFGARRFTQLLAHFSNCSEDEAEKLKMSYVPDWSSQDCPFILATEQFQSELNTAIDNWRSGEIASKSELPIGNIWISGGGARTNQLDKYLQSIYGCNVKILGPEINDNGTIQTRPDYTIALGLALQNCDSAAFSISLAPRLVKWQKKKVSKFKYLVASTAVVFGAIIIGMIATEIWISGQIDTLSSGMAELRECDAIVPKLDNAISQMEYYQKILVPIAEYGSRANTLAAGIKEISKAFTPGDWCFYMADEFSYAESLDNAKSDKNKNDEAAEKGRRKAQQDMFGNPIETPQVVAETKEEKVVLQNMPLLSALYMGGFVPTENNRFTRVKEFQRKLRSSALFSDQLDSFIADWEGNGKEAFTGWQRFFQMQRMVTGEYTDFKLKLPLKTLNVTLPPPPPKTKKNKNN